MKKVQALFYRFTWINLPAALLVALLQRTPVLRLIVSGSEYVASSPVGQVMRGLFTAAALGALHSRAGATTFVQNPQNTVQGAVGSSVSVAFTYTGTPSSPARFQITGGSLPPGLSFVPAPVAGTIRSGTPAITGTPTTAGTFTVFVQGFNAEGLTNNIQQPIIFEISGGVTTTAPSITTQPENQATVVGGNATFTVAATGSPTPTFQWRRNGTNLAGATNATLSLTNVQSADAGTYSVVATNSAGSATSSNATLTVNPVSVPVAFTAHPITQTVSSGSTVALTATATGATSFQWQRNGTTVAGATQATLVLSNVSTANAGAYTLVATGSSGSATSNAANLTVVGNQTPGRLINLSVLTTIPTANESFSVGFVVGGAGTSGNKPLVIRAVGPTLSGFGLAGVSDPKMALVSDQVPAGQNDNWGGGAQLTADIAAVGAFGFSSPTSLDAAMSLRTEARNNSVTVSANANGTGSVLAEVYDASGADFSAATTKRLINVSVIKHLGTGLSAGFVIGPAGTTSKTVLLRAVGPTLGGFGVGGTVADPNMTLRGAGQVTIATNDNWGGAASLSAAFGAVGAFDLVPGSADAAMLITLPPGDYSIEVKGAGTTTGVALIEVYEVP